MNANLSPVREQIDLVRCDQRLALNELRQHLLATKSSAAPELISRITANSHELDLLHKRELSLIETGREPQEEGAA